MKSCVKRDVLYKYTWLCKCYQAKHFIFVFFLRVESAIVENVSCEDRYLSLLCVC